MTKSLDERRKDEKLSFNVIKNSALICKDCIHRLDDSQIPGNTTKCAEYKTLKPLQVLDGKECPKYLKE